MELTSEKDAKTYFTACFTLAYSLICPVLHIFSVLVYLLLWIKR